MKSSHQFILFFGIMVLLSIFGCDKDTTLEMEGSLLPYNPSEHIYSTLGDFGGLKWEAVIDPITGQIDKIPQTKEIFGGLSSPVGTRFLTSFARNERIFIPSSNISVLVLQSLETFEEINIPLVDNAIDENILFPKIVRFGQDQNEVYVLDGTNTLWKIDLTIQLVTRIYERIPLPNDTYIANFFYISSTGHFLLATNKEAVNDATADELLLFDPNIDNASSIYSISPISTGFGFIQHPTTEQIYYLKAPTETTGFRLMNITMTSGNIVTNPKSNSDLAIDRLAPYTQTIHSNKNIYIIRGGSNQFENPTTVLFSINLNSGKLINEAPLQDEAFILKLAGE